MMILSPLNRVDLMMTITIRKVLLNCWTVKMVVIWQLLDWNSQMLLRECEWRVRLRK